MNKESLMAMGLTEEQAKKVMDSLDGNYIPKTRFNEINEELKQAKASLKDRDKQLEDLKKTAGDSEELKKQIEQLQNQNQEQKKAHEAEIKSMKINTAVEMGLTGAKARNLTAVKALLAEFLKTAQLDADGTVRGLDSEIQKLVKDESTSFLFETKQKTGAGLQGIKPGQGGDGGSSGSGGVTLESIRKMSPSERYDFYTNHKEEYQKLYEGTVN